MKKTIIPVRERMKTKLLGEAEEEEIEVEEVEDEIEEGAEGEIAIVEVGDLAEGDLLEVVEKVEEVEVEVETVVEVEVEVETVVEVEEALEGEEVVAEAEDDIVIQSAIKFIALRIFLNTSESFALHFPFHLIFRLSQVGLKNFPVPLYSFDAFVFSSQQPLVANEGSICSSVCALNIDNLFCIVIIFYTTA